MIKTEYNLAFWILFQQETTLFQRGASFRESALAKIPKINFNNFLALLLKLVTLDYETIVLIYLSLSVNIVLK